MTVYDAFGKILSNNPDISYDDATQAWTFSAIVCPTISGVTTLSAHVHQAAGSGGTLDHGAALVGLTDDDHTQYAKLAGRSGGTTQYGGTGAAEDLRLDSTSHGTPGLVRFGGGSDAYYDEAKSSLRVPQISTASEIDVKAYGAVGDGTTDDTAAIQAAIDAVVDCAVTIQISRGSYKVTGLVLRVNTHGIVFEGACQADIADSRLVLSGAGPMFTNAAAALNYIQWKNLNFTQVDASAGHIIQLSDSPSNIALTNVRFALTNPASSFFKLTDSGSMISFDEVVGYMATGATVPAFDMNASTYNIYGVDFRNCMVTSDATATAPIIKQTNTSPFQAYGPHLSNCVFEIPGGGVLHVTKSQGIHVDQCWAGDIANVSDNVFEFVNCQSIVFTATLCYVNTGSPSDIYCDSNCVGLTVIGCFLKSIGAPGVIQVAPYPTEAALVAGTKNLVLTTDCVADVDYLKVGRWVEWTGRTTASAAGMFGPTKTTGYINLGTGDMTGLIEVSITDSYSSVNCSGVLTKQYSVIRSGGGAATQTNRISEVVGLVSQLFNLGDLELDGTNLRVPINWVAGAENCTVRVRALFTTEAQAKALLSALTITDPTGSAAAAVEQYVSWPRMQDVSAVSGAVWKCAADATDPTAGGGAAAGRIPIKIGADTKYIPYY